MSIWWTLSGDLNIQQILANSCFTSADHLWRRPVREVSQPHPPGVNTTLRRAPHPLCHTGKLTLTATQFFSSHLIVTSFPLSFPTPPQESSRVGADERGLLGAWLRRRRAQCAHCNEEKSSRTSRLVSSQTATRLLADTYHQQQQHE